MESTTEAVLLHKVVTLSYNNTSSFIVLIDISYISRYFKALEFVCKLISDVLSILYRYIGSKRLS